MNNLDDLNLDDMFSEDYTALDDMGFDMDGMGDIMKEVKNPQTTTAPPPVRRGPKTQRTNPMLEAAAAADTEQPTAATSNSRRKRAKRKTKTPTPYGDDDDEYMDDAGPPKKKTRKSVTKKGKAEAPATATAKKGKAKKGGAVVKGRKSVAAAAATGMGGRGGSEVAAAGKFGGRMKRGTSTGGSVPKTVKRKKDAGGPSLLPPAAPAAPKPPKIESTFGGLIPGTRKFYPFLESVPAEATLKNRKAYPVFDRITTMLNGAMNAPPAATQAPISPEEAIVKLLFETYEGGTEKEKQAFTTEKRTALLHSIPNLQKYIKSLEKSRLLQDLHGICGLLTRQYNFLNTSLDSMERWCKSDFTPADYDATYGALKPSEINPPVEKLWNATVVKVKVTGSGYKEPKGIAPLLAQLPLYAVDPKVQRTALKKAKAKKDKAAASTSGQLTIKDAPKAPKTYALCSPVERRQRLMRKVTKLAFELEKEDDHVTTQLHGNATGTAASASNKKSAIKFHAGGDDEHLNTSKMWDFVQAAGFYQVPKENQLKLLQTPEIHPTGTFVRAPTRIQGKLESTEDECPEPSSTSLYDRLQSLLVDESEETIGGNNGESRKGQHTSDDDDNSSDEEGEASTGFLDEEEDLDNIETVDLSKLSREERTFVHLCSAGLIRKPVFPSVSLALAEEKAEEKRPDEDDIVNVIGEMSVDLSALTSRNNARMAFLEGAVTRLDLQNEKSVTDEQQSVINRCQSLLKRSKDKAKKHSKQKKDDLNLPW